MWRASSFFSISKEPQFDRGAIQEMRIRTGSACEVPWARSEIAATSPIDHDRISHMYPSREASPGPDDSEFCGPAATVRFSAKLGMGRAFFVGKASLIPGGRGGAKLAIPRPPTVGHGAGAT